VCRFECECVWCLYVGMFASVCVSDVFVGECVRVSVCVCVSECCVGCLSVCFSVCVSLRSGCLWV